VLAGRDHVPVSPRRSSRVKDPSPHAEEVPGLLHESGTAPLGCVFPRKQSQTIHAKEATRSSRVVQSPVLATPIVAPGHGPG
jgi:hypothetical protein